MGETRGGSLGLWFFVLFLDFFNFFYFFFYCNVSEPVLLLSFYSDPFFTDSCPSSSIFCPSTLLELFLSGT